MNFASLKQRLSLQHISSTLRQVIRRFPVTICMFAVLTVLLCFRIWCVSLSHSAGYILLSLSYFFGVGILIDFAFSLWGEERTDHKKRWMAEAAAFIPWGAYCVWLYRYVETVPDTTTGFILGNIAWVMALVLFIPFCAFLREKNDLRTWHFLMAICKAMIISGIVSWVMTGGLTGLVYGTAALFDRKIEEKLIMTIMTVCSIFLWGLLFLALVPDGEKKYNLSPEMPPFLKNVTSWLLLPLLGGYILVLYIYGINILVHWELPKGTLSTLTTSVMYIYLLCYTLLYPKVLDRASWQSRVLTRWLPVIILPLLVLMTVGVIRRFTDYGVTAQRLYLATMLLWFYAVCILMLTLPKKRFNWIFLSFAGLFLLTSGHPFHYFRLTRPVIEAKIDTIIAENGLTLPIARYALTNDPRLTYEAAAELTDALNYMESNYSRKSIRKWTSDEDADSTKTRTKTYELIYHTISQTYPCPQGFATYRKVSSFSDIICPADSMRDGVLHASIRVDTSLYVLMVDTAAVKRAQDVQEPLIIYAPDSLSAFVLSCLNLDGYSDQSFTLSYTSGTLFRK